MRSPHHITTEPQTALASDPTSLLDATFDTVTDAIVIANSNGEIVRANAAFYALVDHLTVHDDPTRPLPVSGALLAERLCQLPIADAAGRPLDPSRRPLHRILQGEHLQAAETDEIRLRALDGRELRMLPSGKPLLDGAGAICGAVLMLRDVTARRHAEAMLYVNEQHFSELINVTPFGVALFDASDDFRFLRYNLSFLDLLGSGARVPSSLIGLSVRDVLRPESEAEVMTIFRQVRTTRQPMLVEEFPAYLLGDAAARWYKWSLAPLCDESGAVIAMLSSAVEVTEHVQLRQALQQQAAELEGIFAALTTAVIVFDRDGTITRLNPVARGFFEAAGRPDFAVQPLNVRQGMVVLRDSVGHVLSEDRWPPERVLHGETISCEDVQFTASTGELRMLNLSCVPLRDDTGAIVSGIAVFQDVTERRWLERRTHTSLEALLHMAQAAVETGEDICMVAQSLVHLAREVLDCQRVGIMCVVADKPFMQPLAVIGLSREEERRWWAMATEFACDGDHCEPSDMTHLASGKPLVIDMTSPPYDQLPNPFNVTNLLYVPMHLDGRLVGFISLDHGGIPHRYTPEEISLAQGMADLAALVVERERLQSETAKAQAKVLALGTTNARMHTFLGIAGHELRTPVTSIKSSVQLTARAVHQALDVDLPADIARRMQRAVMLLDGANAQADKLNRFITDLLDVTRIQNGTFEIHPTALDFVGVVSDAIAAVRPEWEGRIIAFTPPGGEIPVLGDADRLGQVVTNLVTNALKYSPPSEPVMVHLSRTGLCARLEVVDRGQGLTPEQLTQLFQAFGRVEGITQQSGTSVGLGLGLFICKTIVGQLGGTMGALSPPGQGATFWCELPLVREETAQR